MIRRPPRSTLFPTRRSSDLSPRVEMNDGDLSRRAARYVRDRAVRTHKDLRSEEHTSELQSRLHLVCRLLLEKKKRTEYKQAARRDITETYQPHSTAQVLPAV